MCAWTLEGGLRRSVRSSDEGLSDDLGNVSGESTTHHRGDEVPTLGAVMNSITRRLEHFDTLFSELRDENQELLSTVGQLVQQSTQLVQQSTLLSQQTTQMNQTLEQILQQSIARHGQHGNHPMAEFPLQQQQVASTELTGVIPEDSSTAVPFVPLRLPNALKGLQATTVFRGWYLKGYHHMLSDKSHVRSKVKFVVEYLNLFLEKHIEPMPQDPSKYAPWKEMVEEQAAAAWNKAQNFAKDNGGGSLPRTITVVAFKRFIQACNHNNLPGGPAGECHFQPDKEKLRNKKDLLRHNEENRSKKRTAVEAEIIEAINSESEAEPESSKILGES